MKRSGLKQQDVRESAGISRQTFANVFSGQADFKLSTLLSLADRLGLELLLLPKDARPGRPVAADAPVVETLVDRARSQLADLSSAGRKP